MKVITDTENINEDFLKSQCVNGNIRTAISIDFNSENCWMGCLKFQSSILIEQP